MKSVRSESRLARRAGAAALAFIGTFAAGALARAESVSFNPDGTGNLAAATGLPIDGHGSGFVMLQPQAATPYVLQFVETGAYQLTTSDGSSPLGRQDITLTYSVFGTLDAFTGQASFAGGVVNLYADSRFNFGQVAAGSPVVYGANDGTLIASFQVDSGSGVASSSVTLQASSVAGSLKSGYFVSSAGTDAGAQPLLLTVQIGNTVDTSPSPAVVSEIVCKAASFAGPGCAGGSYANTAYYFVVTDHAVTTLSAVPEPASGALALAGLGLIGLVARRRLGRGGAPG